MIENCKTQCAGCGLPVAYQWSHNDGPDADRNLHGAGFISSPDTVLIADWLFHAECWKDPEPDGGQMEGNKSGTERDKLGMNDDDIDF